MDRLSTSQGGLFLPILTHRNDRGRWLNDSNNSWNPAYNCFDRPGKNVSLLRYTSTAKITIC